MLSNDLFIYFLTQNYHSSVEEIIYFNFEDKNKHMIVSLKISREIMGIGSVNKKIKYK
jgi:hypothetical protein